MKRVCYHQKWLKLIQTSNIRLFASKVELMGSEPQKASLKSFYEARIWKPHRELQLYEQIRLRNVFEFLQPKAGDVFLDAGCGGCIYSRYVAKVSDVVAADISKRGLENAKLDLSRVSSRMHLIVCDNEYLPLRDKSVNKVLSIDTMEHVADPRLFLKELRRVSNSEAKLLLFAACGKNKMTLENLLTHFPTAGNFIERIRFKFGHLNVFTTEQLVGLLEPDFAVVRVGYMHHWIGWLFKFLWDIRNLDSVEDCGILPQFQDGVFGSLSKILWRVLAIEHRILKSVNLGTEVKISAVKK